MDEGRGSLPFALLHGEALVACAAWGLSSGGVTPVDPNLDWDILIDTAEPLVLHDALCPMTPPTFIAECVDRAQASGAVVIGVRPVTDTVKQIAEGIVGETVDREGLLSLASPLVLPAAVVASLDGWPGHDFTAIISGLVASGHAVETVVAPPEARRVDSVDGVRLLEALTQGSRAAL